MHDKREKLLVKAAKYISFSRLTSHTAMISSRSPKTKSEGIFVPEQALRKIIEMRFLPAPFVPLSSPEDFGPHVLQISSIIVCLADIIACKNTGQILLDK